MVHPPPPPRSRSGDGIAISHRLWKNVSAYPPPPHFGKLAEELFMYITHPFPLRLVMELFCCVWVTPPPPPAPPTPPTQLSEKSFTWFSRINFTYILTLFTKNQTCSTSNWIWYPFLMFSDIYDTLSGSFYVIMSFVKITISSSSFRREKGARSPVKRRERTDVID